MKTRLTSLILLLFISQCFASTWVPLQVDMKGTHEAHSGTSAEEKHHRWLEIKVSGTGLKDSAQLRLEWTFFSDDLSADKIVKQADGTELIDLLPGKSGSVKTKEVIFDYTRQHSERILGGRRPVFKKIDATGHRYHGWGVRAFIGDEKVGEPSAAETSPNWPPNRRRPSVPKLPKLSRRGDGRKRHNAVNFRTKKQP